MSKAVVFFAEGTEECEALLVVDLLRRAKVDVTVASASGSREILSSHKIRITADALAEEVDYSDVDLVVLPGGIPGTPNLAANKTVTDTCTAFAKSGKKVAAICAAPSVLASLGLNVPAAMAGASMPSIGLEQLLAVNPAWLLVAHYREESIVKRWQQDPLWQMLTAAQKQQVASVDSNTWARMRGIFAAERIAADTVKIFHHQPLTVVK